MFYVLMGLMMAGIVGLDQWTKALIVENVPMHAELDSVLGIFHITHSENDGAIWGILEGQTWLFVLVMVAFVALFAVMIWKKWLTHRFEFFCLAMIAGGGIGNMIDRLFRGGSVTDMIEFDFISFPVFNVADCFITAGCAGLMGFLLIEQVKEWKSKKS